MQKLCCVCTRQQFSASLDYFVTSSPPYLHQFSTISGGNCIKLISYNQLLEHLENAQDHDMGMNQELYRFRAIIGHQGRLLASDPDWKGKKYNVQVEWVTGEITFEPSALDW